MRTQVHKVALALLAVAFICQGQSKLDPYIIKGRVVDDGGKPLAGIGICFEPDVYRGAWDRFIECSGSASDGKFEEEVGRATKGQLYFLFVYDDDGTKGISLLDPPFDWLRRRDRSFNGIPVRLGKKSLTDLGDINVRFYFGDAILDFSRHKTKVQEEVNWSGLYIAVRHKSGRYVAYSSLSNNDIELSGNVDKSKNTLRITLPIGYWKVEAIWNDKVLAESDFFDVVRSSPQTVLMKSVQVPRTIRPEKL